jgi:hypothetical protein
MEITQKIAQKVLDTVNAGLVKDLGQPIPGKMCVEAAVCFAMGLPHSDKPPCVSSVLCKLKIGLNDSNWSSKLARANGLRELALLQLGTAGILDEVEFAKRVTLLVINKYLPPVLRKVNLNQEADACEQAKDLVVAHAATGVAVNATYIAANTAALATNAAAYTATNIVARAAYAAAAWAAVTDTAADVATWAIVDAADAVRSLSSSDDILLSFAKDVSAILIDMKVPGVQWLNLIQNNDFDNQKGILKYIMKWIYKIIPRTASIH